MLADLAAAIASWTRAAITRWKMAAELESQAGADLTGPRAVRSRRERRSPAILGRSSAHMKAAARGDPASWRASDLLGP